MAEISKEIKVVCIINAIIASFYGFLYLIIPDIYRYMIDSLWYDPGMWRIFGATCFVIAIFNLLAIKRAEWDEAKVILEFGILWLILVLIINIWSFVALPGSATAKATTMSNNIVLIVLIGYNVLFYYRETK